MSEAAPVAVPGPEGHAAGDHARSTGKGAGKNASLFARIALFVRQVVAELKKVVWPTRSDWTQYVIVVLVFVTVMMGFIVLLDLGVGWLAMKVFGD